MYEKLLKKFTLLKKLLLWYYKKELELHAVNHNDSAWLEWMMNPERKKKLWWKQMTKRENFWVSHTILWNVSPRKSNRCIPFRVKTNSFQSTKIFKSHLLTQVLPEFPCKYTYGILWRQTKRLSEKKMKRKRDWVFYVFDTFCPVFFGKVNILWLTEGYDSP